MPRRTRTPRAVPVALFSAGLAVAAFLVAANRVEASVGDLGADVSISTLATGELALPTQPFLRGVQLRPAPAGRAIDVDLPVGNHTGFALGVRMRALPSNTELDRVLRLHVRNGNRTLFRGTLGELRRWTPANLRLAPSATQHLRVRAWVGASAGSTYQGRMSDVSLELKAHRIAP